MCAITDYERIGAKVFALKYFFECVLRQAKMAFVEYQCADTSRLYRHLPSDFVPTLSKNCLTTLRRACEKVMVTTERLTKYGRAAIQQGPCLPHNHRKEIQLFPEGTYWSVQDPVPYNWNHLDGTIASGSMVCVTDVVKPHLHRNSCWLDVMIVVALYMDAGRIVYDQVDEAQLSDMSECGRGFRRALILMRDPQTDSRFANILRNNIRVTLHKALKDIQASSNLYDPTHMQLTNNFTDPLTPAYILFSAFPQCTTTVVKAYQCCDSVIQVSRWAHPLRLPVLVIERQEPSWSLTRCMNNFFQRTSVFNCQCSSEHRCVREGFVYNLVLDQTAPMLIVKLPEIVTAKQNDTWRLFSKQHLIVYTSVSGTRSVEYQTVGGILHNGFDPGHYTLRWWLTGLSSGASVVEYDSMRLGEKNEHRLGKNFWNSLGPEQSTGYVYVFLRLKSPKPES